MIIGYLLDYVLNVSKEGLHDPFFKTNKILFFPFWVLGSSKVHYQFTTFNWLSFNSLLLPYNVLSRKWSRWLAQPPSYLNHWKQRSRAPSLLLLTNIEKLIKQEHSSSIEKSKIKHYNLSYAPSFIHNQTIPEKKKKRKHTHTWELLSRRHTQHLRNTQCGHQTPWECTKQPW